MDAVPAAIPVTMPDAEPTMAADDVVAHLLPLALANVMLLPLQTDEEPVIVPGEGCTVTGIVATQPVGNV